MTDVRFVRAQLFEPGAVAGVYLDDPPIWLVRVGLTIDGREAVVAWRFTNEQAARDLLAVCEDAPETVAAMAADMLTQSLACPACGSLRVADLDASAGLFVCEECGARIGRSTPEAATARAILLWRGLGRLARRRRRP